MLLNKQAGDAAAAAAALISSGRCTSFVPHQQLELEQQKTQTLTLYAPRCTQDNVAGRVQGGCYGSDPSLVALEAAPEVECLCHSATSVETFQTRNEKGRTQRVPGP